MVLKSTFESSALLDRGGKPTVRELLSSLVFNPVDGTIRLNGDRLVMQRAAVGMELRRELVRLLGPVEARVFLLRLGFLCGQADARFVRTSWPGLNIGDAFTAGTRLHMFSGVVRVETVHNDFDFRKKRFSGEFLWHDSAEGSEFQRNDRPAKDPACWTQTGYASGYASEFFDTLIVYREVECCAQGHKACRVIGKPADMWPAGDSEVALFRERIVGHGPMSGSFTPPSTMEMRLRASDTALSELDRQMIAPVREALARLAGKQIPVLIWGAAGTGRFRAAQVLHRLSAKPGTGLRRVHGSDITIDQINAIATPPTRKGAAETLVIDGLEDVPPNLQRHLALALEEGIVTGGPIVLALSDRSPAALGERLTPALVYAFASATLEMPPFTDGKRDVGGIAQALLPVLAARLGQGTRRLSPATCAGINRLDWRGNLPELRATLSAALIASAGRSDDDLPLAAIEAARTALELPPPAASALGTKDWIDAALDAGTLSLDALQDEICARAVARTSGNLSAAARLAGMTRAQLAYRVQKSEIAPKSFTVEPTPSDQTPARRSRR